MSESIVWADGKCVAESQQLCSAFDRGLTVGLGVFETLCVYDGEPFAFNAHYQRLLAGADRLSLDVPKPEVLRQAIVEVVEKNDLRSGKSRARITLLAGQSGRSCQTVVTAQEIVPRKELSKVVISSYQMNEHSPLTGIKSIAYAENVLALEEAQREGADEVIFANSQGHLCEGATSNVFVIKKDTIMTPTLASGCLPGITRSIVIELCDQFDLDLLECDLPVDCLIEADEAFLTSSLREIQPVAQVDGVHLPHVAGVITRQLQEAYQHRVEG